MILRISFGSAGQAPRAEEKDADPPGNKSGPEKSDLSLRALIFFARREIFRETVFLSDLLRSGSLHAKTAFFKATPALAGFFSSTASRTFLA